MQVMILTGACDGIGAENAPQLVARPGRIAALVLAGGRRDKSS